ncbi:hypothetical protein AVEN_213211-1 [Araneus ventricosus]|uniref:Uncharacterized protein n=1 Tax=Araneus ventricosus TaxID=182803 RepID=A0A4Y2MYY8_ARAVE|nr:hypothetical protein AVEN_176613-1 [Araneus ventricosus]GBN31581.1 hypothetical protein AVEN_213211-1 [Araneus ventricosus]
MDIENTFSLIVLSSWFWTTAKYIIFQDLYDLIVDIFYAVTLTGFGYLLVALNRTIRGEKKDPMKIDEDKRKMKVDGICQMDEQNCREKSMQVEKEKSDISAKGALNQSLEKITQSKEIKGYTSTQRGQIQFNTASTQTLSEIQHDKEIQAFLQVSENKETQTSVKFFSDKEVQTEAIPNAKKVFVPVKSKKPKPTIPLTKEFLNHHQRKHDVQRSKIKFKPKLDVITEVEGSDNDPELHKLPSAGEMESETAVVDGMAAVENSSEMSSLKSENSCKILSTGEMETESRIVDKTSAADNSSEMSSEKSENSCKDDLHLKVGDEIKFRKEVKKRSFLKKKFKKLKNFFKK